MAINIVSSIIAFILFRICENMFYIKASERKDRGRWFLGRSHAGNDDRIIYAYYPEEVIDGNRKYNRGIYTEDINSADIDEDKWII